MTTNDDVFVEENKQGSGSFFKFEKIGDKVLGYLVSSKKKEKEGIYGEQMIYKLEKEDGEMTNVAVKMYTAERVEAAGVKRGQQIGFKFEKEFETKFANKGKDIGVYITQKFKEPKNELDMLGF